MTLVPPNSEPDEPTTVPPVGVETPAKPQIPADERDIPVSTAAAPEPTVRKAPVRKAPARPTGASRTPAARSSKPSAAPLADGAEVPPTSAGPAPKPRTTKPAARTAAARPATGRAKAASAVEPGADALDSPVATPAAARSAAAKATSARTATARTESAAKSTAARADTAKARAAKAAATRAAALSASLGQAVAEPTVAEPTAAEPAVAEPAVAEPAVAEPTVAEPVAAETAVAEPAVGEPEAVTPEPVDEAVETVVPPASAAETLPPDDAGPVLAPEADPTAPPAVAVRAPKKAPGRTPRTSTKRRPKSAPPVPEGPLTPLVLSVTGLKKSFGNTVAVSGIDLEVREGSFYGIVGPNGAGKTTTLSMITGLLRPDAGAVQVHGIDVWGSPIAAKRIIGVLPDRLRLFDRLTGAQLLYYSGVLRGLDGATVRKRSADLAAAFGLEDALNRLVADYSAGMTKKIALACAMIHSPRLLVLDEPFESVDPVSAVNVTEILQKYVASGGTVVLSSHGMDLIQRVCDHVAIIVQGAVLASGTIDEVRGEKTLEERFIELAGGRKVAEGMEWLHSFSD
ncbi:ABC transporter ATP-binding protein [Cryobacterium mannosilyticum]|uniref:ABC transporter ATP-binding protein n=1 Tax=Cryobacterium mannosilyticum TaxID=1259190 RepID=UPI001F54091D|nr:ABC transporter ATP-binding protein [Cryobacterium mannosilyticum]